MDSVPQAVALTPLAFYLLWLGAIHLRRRPAIWSGAADNAALALAVAGLVIVGPMELLMPRSGQMSSGILWMLMLSLYALSVTLWNLLSRPRLVICSAAADAVHEALAQVLPRLDAQASRAGDSYLLPQTGLHFHVDGYGALRIVTLNSIGERQSFSGWARLKTELRGALAPRIAPPGQQGVVLAAIGAVLLAVSLHGLWKLDRVTARQQWRSLTRQIDG